MPSKAVALAALHMHDMAITVMNSFAVEHRHVSGTQRGLYKQMLIIFSSAFKKAKKLFTGWPKLFFLVDYWEGKIFGGKLHTMSPSKKRLVMKTVFTIFIR